MSLMMAFTPGLVRRTVGGRDRRTDTAYVGGAAPKCFGDDNPAVYRIAGNPVKGGAFAPAFPLYHGGAPRVQPFPVRQVPPEIPRQRWQTSFVQKNSYDPNRRLDKVRTANYRPRPGAPGRSRWGGS